MPLVLSVLIGGRDSAIASKTFLLNCLLRPLRPGTSRIFIRNMTTPTAIVVPDGFTLHTENSSHILLPSTNEAFLNPVQEFNRDLSVACIRTWGDILNEEKEKTWRQGQERRAKKQSRAKQSKRPKSELQNVECDLHSIYLAYPAESDVQPTPELAAGQLEASHEKSVAENTGPKPDNQPTSGANAKNAEVLYLIPNTYGA